MVWEHPPLERYLRRLASFSRLILFNPRGSSLSDPIPRGFMVPEDLTYDAQLVPAAVDSERTAMFTIEATSQPALLCAASHPERTSAWAILNGRRLGAEPTTTETKIE